MIDKHLNSKGTYILFLNFSSGKEIAVGALGKIKFNKGYYAYIGSAFGPGGLQARLKHHLYSNTKPRWHLDYLKPHALIEQIWITSVKKRYECIWADELAKHNQEVTGFGASDCQCDSHLLRIAEWPLKKNFRKKIAPQSIRHINRSKFNKLFEVV